MVEVNLLPWRQRQRRRKKYWSRGGIVCSTVGLLFLLWYAWQPQALPAAPPGKHIVSVSPLLQWRYVGYVQIENHFIGLLAAPDGQTHAVTKGIWLQAAGAKIVDLDPQHLVLKQPQHAHITLALRVEPAQVQEGG